MLSDLKHKRKIAGFIRTNSFKALPTFKNTVKNQSSQDFSSFQNEKGPQQSDQQFSPYKDSPKNKTKRPPLPYKPQQNNNYPSVSIYQTNTNFESEKDPIQIFTNEKLKRNYDADAYAYKSTHHNYLSQSPNCGKIVNRHKMANSNVNNINLNKRQQQIKQNLRKRAQVERQLSQIDKICTQIDHIRSPKEIQQKYKRISRSNINCTPKSPEKQENVYKKLYQKELQQQQRNPALSYQKYKYIDKQKQQKKNLQQITTESYHPQILISQTPKVTFSLNTENNSIINNQGRRSFPNTSSKPNLNHQLLNTLQPRQNKKISINSQIQSHMMHQSIKNTTSRQNQSKINSTGHHGYQFEEQNSQSEESQNFQQSQQPIKDNQQEQFSSFKYQHTFKPNANQQILTSIQEYKKLHPDQYINTNTNKKIQKQAQNYNKSKSTSQIQSQIKVSHIYQDKIKNEHDRARQKFFSSKQHQKSDEQPQSEEQEQSQGQQYSDQDGQEQFSDIQQSNYRKKNYQQEDLIQQQQQQLITQYPTAQFKKISIKQCVQSNLSNYNSSQRPPKTQNQNFNYNTNSSNMHNPKKIMQPVLENNSAIHKSKGGICFDLDVNQFTQIQTKPSNKHAAQPIRRNKKTNTKEQILKRRQNAKNYDRQARARVFGGY